MRKVLLISAAMLLALLLYGIVAHNSSEESENSDFSPPTVNLPQDYSVASELTKADFLYDFDYMIDRMSKTFPYFGVIERRFGVDVMARAAEVRSLIENYPHSMKEEASFHGISFEDMPPMCRLVFWSIIRHEFFLSLPYTAHLGMFVGLTAEDLNEFFQELEYIHEADQELFSFIVREFSVFDELKEAVFWWEPIPEISMTTEILVEDTVAYLRIPTFMPNYGIRQYSNLLGGFFRSIQAYEHLIIDIRDSGGGQLELMLSLVMYTLQNDFENYVPIYVFYRDSLLASKLAKHHLHYGQEEVFFYTGNAQETQIDDLKGDGNLLYLNSDDFKELGIGFRLDNNLKGVRDRLGFQGMFMPTATPFDGTIWLLTSQQNVSASAIFAFIAKELGFATLVGDTVGGHFTTYTRTRHHRLPNTGLYAQWDVDYVTDENGRALEEFPTQPHFFNRPGMDARETVLMIIEERR